MKNIILFFFLFISTISFATDYEPKDVAELRAQYNLLVDLKNQDAISEDIFVEKTNKLKQLATEKFQVNLEGLELQQIVPAQRIDWIGSALYVISAILVLLLLAPLFAKLRIPFIKLIKLLFDNDFFKNLARQVLKFLEKTWEFFAYIAIGACLYLFENEYIVLLMSFLEAPLLTFTVVSRRQDEKQFELFNTIASLVVTIVWAIIAYLHNNAFVGFLAVASFISSIGFAMFMAPQMVAIGFKKSSPIFVFRLTAITFFLSIFSWLLFYTNYIPAIEPLKKEMRVFETGMVSLIPLVYFLGLGYMTFFVYRHNWKLRIISELVALLCGVGVLVISLVYGISSMFWIGLLFMIWFTIDKYYELIYKQVDFVWAGLILAGILGGLGYWIKNNMVFIMNNLEFLNL